MEWHIACDSVFKVQMLSVQRKKEELKEEYSNITN